MQITLRVSEDMRDQIEALRPRLTQEATQRVLGHGQVSRAQALRVLLAYGLAHVEALLNGQEGLDQETLARALAEPPKTPEPPKVQAAPSLDPEVADADTLLREVARLVSFESPKSGRALAAVGRRRFPGDSRFDHWEKVLSPPIAGCQLGPVEDQPTPDDTYAWKKENAADYVGRYVALSKSGLIADAPSMDALREAVAERREGMFLFSVHADDVPA